MLAGRNNQPQKQQKVFSSILLILITKTKDQVIGCPLWERFMFPILHSALISKQIGNGAKVNRHVGSLA